MLFALANEPASNFFRCQTPISRENNHIGFPAAIHVKFHQLTTLQYDTANLPRKIVKNTTSADFYEAQGGRYLQRMTADGTAPDTFAPH
jgi:hypothetical protein